MNKRTCVFKQAYLDQRTSFWGCEGWNEQHPLYKCAYECHGYMTECIGYMSIEECERKLADYGEKV